MLIAQRGKSLTTVTRIRLTLILVWIVLVLPGNGKGAEDCRILLVRFPNPLAVRRGPCLDFTKQGLNEKNLSPLFYALFLN